MSDAQGRLVVALRDYRPYIAPLIRLGRIDLAQLLAQTILMITLLALMCWFGASSACWRIDRCFLVGEIAGTNP
jgi:hypothetical protein